MRWALIFLISLMLASCSPLVQKAYFVQSPNVGAFDTAKVTNVKLSGCYFTNTELQLSHSLTNHAGVFGGALWGYQGWDDKVDSLYAFDSKPGLLGTFGLNAGGMWFTQKGHTYLELALGYGYQFNNSRMYGRYVSVVSGFSGPWLDQDVHSSFHRIIFQPSLLYLEDDHILGLVLRSEWVYCPYYYYAHNVSVYDEMLPGYYDYEDQISFYNKNFFTLTPYFVLSVDAGKTTWNIYAGAVFSNEILRHTGSTDHVNPKTFDYIIDRHPAMASVVLGMEIGLKWKKK